MDGKCTTENTTYRCIATVHNLPDKAYISTVEEKFKTRFYNHSKYKKYANETALSTYVWKMKEHHNVILSLKWSMIKSVPSYSNISKRYMLYFHEKFEILNYLNQDQLLNGRSELISNCCHANKYLLSNYKSKD